MDDWQIFVEYYVMDERFIAGVLVTLVVMLLANLTISPIAKRIVTIRQFFQPPKKPPKQEDKPVSLFQQALGCIGALLWLALIIGGAFFAVFLFWGQG